MMIERDLDGAWWSGAIEALARAIYHKDQIYKPPFWDDCTTDMKTWYRSTARAGLDALEKVCAE